MNRIAMIAVLSAAVTVNASAQEPAGWGRVLALKPGTAIVIVVRDSTPVKRHVVTADDAWLTLREERTSQSTETVAKADIIEIQAPKRRSMARKITSGVIGYFVGGVTGGMLGMAITQSLSGIVGVFPGEAIGILVGVRGGFRRPYEVIYSH